jgi:hypothetical protein
MLPSLRQQPVATHSGQSRATKVAPEHPSASPVLRIWPRPERGTDAAQHPGPTSRANIPGPTSRANIPGPTSRANIPGPTSRAQHPGKWARRLAERRGRPDRAQADLGSRLLATSAVAGEQRPLAAESGLCSSTSVWPQGRRSSALPSGSRGSARGGRAILHRKSPPCAAVRCGEISRSGRARSAMRCRPV